MLRTPNLDHLAAKGVRFSGAYCNSPICVPSRAALATGRYVHRIRFWDNAIPYDGSVRSWHHRLREAGHEATAIGKLHFRSAEDDNGFTREIMPLHVVDGIGNPLGWLRDPLPVRKAALRLANDAGRGNSSYHGDNLGTRRLWGKSTMYEESAGVPMILAGPAVPEGFVCHELVSLVDCFPTVVDCVGAPPHPDDRDLPGALFEPPVY
jgi:arylsulfatase A-like enzyme